MNYKFFILFLVYLSACTPKPPIPPIPPLPPAPYDANVDTDIDDAVLSTCSNLCKHLQAIHCLAGDLTVGGSTCVDVCTNIQTSGVISLDIACRIRATTCAAVDLCK